MKRKDIGIGVVIVMLLGVSSAFYFSVNYPTRPDRKPDMIGEFQRVEGNKLILKPLDRENLPFAGMSREEIRAKMQAITPEEREIFRAKMKELLQEEEGIILADDMEVVMNRRKIKLENLEPEIGVQIWLKLDGSNEAEFVSARRTLGKKVDH